MGECIISRRGGEAYKVPTLNASYPQDLTVAASSIHKATFTVVIAEHGNPAEYTYQWFVNGSAVSGATSASYSRAITAQGTFTVHCEVENKAGIVISRAATLVVQNPIPTYTYTGTCNLADEGNCNWRITFLTSGTFTPGRTMTIDACLVGGGGGGTNGEGGGGGGGYVHNITGITLTGGTAYTVTIGAGGAINWNGSRGGTTSIGSYKAGGGYGGVHAGAGGNGGSGGGSCYGGNGGSNGYNGGSASGKAGGTGQRNLDGDYGEDGSTYPFNNTSMPIYSGGGGGGAYSPGAGGAGGGGKGCPPGGHWGDCHATANTGGGGGGGCSWFYDAYYDYSGGRGGSGIIIIRNAR